MDRAALILDMMCLQVFEYFKTWFINKHKAAVDVIVTAATVMTLISVMNIVLDIKLKLVIGMLL